MQQLLSPKRRQIIKTLGTTTLLSTGGLSACANMHTLEKDKQELTKPLTPSMIGDVVIIGGGFGGATAAKYLRVWGKGLINVTLIERQSHFISCPMSNLVIGGHKHLNDITFDYDGLRRLGVKIVQGEVIRINSTDKTVNIITSTLNADKQNKNNNASLSIPYPYTLHYDRLIVSPGIEFMFDAIEGLDIKAQSKVLHAWKAGEQTVQLQQSLASMKQGGIVAISIPKSPYRCPPGPYERACQMAYYLQQHNPTGKVIILDANEDIQSKKALFSSVFKTQYPHHIEYRSRFEVKRLEIDTMTVESELGDRLTADVLNLIPPMQAGKIAQESWLTAHTQGNEPQWCPVNWLTMESTLIKNIHVLGDATQSSGGMPKSGHIANQHGKIAAAAIVELMNNRIPRPLTMLNTCYSYIDKEQAIHVTGVYQPNEAEYTALKAVPQSGGVSDKPSVLEGEYAWAWANAIWQDTLNL